MIDHFLAQGFALGKGLRDGCELQIIRSLHGLVVSEDIPTRSEDFILKLVAKLVHFLEDIHLETAGVLGQSVVGALGYLFQVGCVVSNVLLHVVHLLPDVGLHSEELFGQSD